MAVKKQCSSCWNLYDLGTKCKCYYKNRKLNSKDDGFYASKKWRAKREEIILRDGGYCQKCFALRNHRVMENLEVHHRIARSRPEGKELELSNDNLITLCKNCNLELGVSEDLGFDWTPPQIKKEVLL